jgi:hypothetical protein
VGLIRQVAQFSSLMIYLWLDVDLANSNESQDAIIPIVGAVSCRWPNLKKFKLVIRDGPPRQFSEANFKQMIALFKNVHELEIEGIFISSHLKFEPSLIVSSIKKLSLSNLIEPNHLSFIFKTFPALQNLSLKAEPLKGDALEKWAQVKYDMSCANLESFSLEVAEPNVPAGRRTSKKDRDLFLKGLRELLHSFPKLRRLWLCIPFLGQRQRIQHLTSTINHLGQLEHLTLASQNTQFKLSDFECILPSLKRFRIENLELTSESLRNMLQTAKNLRMFVFSFPDMPNQLRGVLKSCRIQYPHVLIVNDHRLDFAHLKWYLETVP